MRKKLIERNAPPEWNVRVMDDEDFAFHCGLRAVLVQSVPMERAGASFKRRGQNVIWINERLRGAARIFASFHELGHVILHPPGIQFFHAYGSIVDDEANAFAACAMIPLLVLLRFPITDIAENYNYPLSLVAERLHIYDKWRF